MERKVIQVTEYKYKNGKKRSQRHRVYDPGGISPALCAGLRDGNFIMVYEDAESDTSR